MTAVCSECNQTNRVDARFCRKCGSQLEEAEAPAYVPDTMPIPAATSVTGRTMNPAPAELPDSSTGRRLPGSTSKIVIATLVAAVIIALLAVVIVSTGRRPPKANGTPPANPTPVDTTAVAPTDATVPPTTAASDTGTVATQLAALLQQDKGARDLVVAATQNVGSCQESPGQGIQELQQAIATRNETLNSVNSLTLTALPGGTDMARLLGQAFHASVNADTDFIGWMNDIASRGCPVPTASDSSYQAATAASQQATGAKQEFVGLWNPIAAQYGLTSLTDADL